MFLVKAMSRLLFVLLALTPLFARAADLALVVDSADASLSVIDMAHQTELRRIPVLREPHHLMLSPDARSLLVGDSAGNEILFLDPRDFALQRRVPVADPYQIGFSPDGKFLVVNGLARAQVDVYDAASMKLVKRFPLASMPSHMAFAPDGSVVYVSLQGTDKLAAIDLHAMSVLWVVPVGHAPAGVLWLRGQVLVANMGQDDVSVLDPIDGHTLRRVKTGRGAHQLFLSPDGHTLYVNDRVDGTTVALDPVSLRELRVYKIPGGPDCIDFAPDGKLWITQRWLKRVAVLDPHTGEFHSIDVGRSPHGIFLTTDLAARG